MVFAALTSAFVVRRGLTDMNEWVSIHKPPILFWNTGILLLSSLLLDRLAARLEGRRPQRGSTSGGAPPRCSAFSFSPARHTPGIN
jgi:heme/copper-type cytochrome/quinol oxidase subunit 3